MGRVRAEVFDARGRLVRTIFRGVLEAGARTLSWDGRDAAGRAAAPGEYFVLVRHNDQLFTRKAILVD
jgi:flagellar hook assembly protein FlgD